MLIKKVLVILAIFWSFTIAINHIRSTNGYYGIHPDHFHANKLLWNNEFDIAFVGDSWTVLGISPEIIEKVIPEARICNFAFEAHVYEENYLNRIEDVLKKDSKIKSIVLAISPRLLLDKNPKMSKFIEWGLKNKLDILINQKLGWVKKLFRNLDNTELTYLTKNLNMWGLKIYFPSGWRLTRSYKKNETYTGTTKYNRKKYSKVNVSQKKIKMIMTYTKKWVEKGINVYAVRIPIDKKIEKIHDEMSGLNYKIFRQKFRANGGMWLNVKLQNYSTADGVHLNYESSIKFSYRVAVLLRNNLRKKADVL